MEPSAPQPPTDPQGTGPISDEDSVPVAAPGQFIAPRSEGLSISPHAPEQVMHTAVPVDLITPPSITPLQDTGGMQPPTPLVTPFSGSLPLNQTPKRSRKPKAFTTLLIILAAFIVLGGGGAAYYFGYYMNANVIWSRSLGNTAQGYNKLVSYLNTQSTAHYKGVDTTGNFTLQEGTTHYDGTTTVQSEGENVTGSLAVNVGTTQVGMQLRSVTVPNASEPDIYLQLNGITGLGDVLGSSFGSAVNGLNGKWIAINHTLLEDAESDIPQLTSKVTPPSEAEIVAAAKAVGTVDQKYVFTTNKQYAVTTVTKKVGIETINGQKMYHYKVGFVKQNVKAYITALRDTLQQSKLGAWLKSETGNSVNTIIGYNSLESSANNIKSSDTVDVWVNMKTRLIYKVRVSDKTNPAENYADFGLNYSGGNTFPFFMATKSTTNGVTDSGSLTATINTKTNVVGVNLSYDEPNKTDPLTATVALSMKPSNQPVTVTAPQSSESLSAVLDQLGLGSFVDELFTGAGSNTATSNPTTDLLGSSL